MRPSIWNEAPISPSARPDASVEAYWAAHPLNRVGQVPPGSAAIPLGSPSAAGNWPPASVPIAGSPEWSRGRQSSVYGASQDGEERMMRPPGVRRAPSVDAAMMQHHGSPPVGSRIGQMPSMPEHQRHRSASIATTMPNGPPGLSPAAQPFVALPPGPDALSTSFSARQTIWPSGPPPPGSPSASLTATMTAGLDGRGRYPDPSVAASPTLYRRDLSIGASPHVSSASIAYSNMSPFTRDGNRPLVGSLPSGGRPREYSLGAVGSQRMTGGMPASFAGSGIWPTSVDEGDEDAAPPTRSGATSRRHSFAAFAPTARSQVGFHIPDSAITGPPSAAHPLSPPYANGQRSLGGYDPFSSAGRLALDDDDLLSTDLNALHLDLESHVGSPPRPTGMSAGSPRSGGPGIAMQASRSNSMSRAPTAPSISGMSATTEYFVRPPQTNAWADVRGPPTYFGAQMPPQGDLNELGKGVPLHAIPQGSMLYIVAFKAGRTDIFYPLTTGATYQDGNLVVVEADRGKDLGRITGTPISLVEVRAFQQHQVGLAVNHLQSQTNPPPSAQTIARLTKDLHPKRIYGLASPSDVQLLAVKAEDENKAHAICREKVMLRGIPMEITDAEWQFDRRKLTLYYIASSRVDFRELVRDCFKTFKTRLWLSPVEAPPPAPQGRF